MKEKRVPVFVIMPFSKTTEEHTEQYWTEHFNNFLIPIIEENKKFKAIRSEALRGDILRDIIKELVSCPIVLADITDTNPNVFLELGIRQSFTDGTIIIAEKGTKIPFDISIKGIITYYPKDHLKYQTFKKRLQKALNDCVKNPEKPDSIVLETISGRSSLYQIIHIEENKRKLEALLVELWQNEALCEMCFEIAQKNEKADKELSYPSHCFRTNALELLITTRYLDEDEAFYNLGTDLFHNCIIRNNSLDKWPLKYEMIQEWFLSKEREKEWKTVYEKFLKKVETSLERLNTT